VGGGRTARPLAIDQSFISETRYFVSAEVG
jgi:hypothetical protein